MNARTAIYGALLLAILSTVQPCWAQLVDPATQLRTPMPIPGRRVFDVRNTGMSPEIVRPGVIDVRRPENRHVSPAVIEQIGKVKKQIPSHFGIR